MVLHVQYYTITKFAKKIGVSASTLRRWDDTGKFICHNRTPTGYRIYSEEQYIAYMQGKTPTESYCTNVDFELFKSDVCQKVKTNVIGWLKTILTNDTIRMYYTDDKVLFALYLLAMADKQLKRLGLMPVREYKDLRQLKMKERIYPLSAQYGEFDWSDADPEFLKYNIVEGDIDNVV